MFIQDEGTKNYKTSWKGKLEVDPITLPRNEKIKTDINYTQKKFFVILESSIKLVENRDFDCAFYYFRH